MQWAKVETHPGNETRQGLGFWGRGVHSCCTGWVWNDGRAVLSHQTLQDENAALPMMYMPDCLEGTFQLMTAPQEALSQVGQPCMQSTCGCGERPSSHAMALPPLCA